MVNPASGRALDPAPLVAAMPGDVTVLAPGEAVGHPDRIVIASGDGTIAPAAATAAELGVPLGVIPGGTANDFARVNGLPFDPVEAARLAATGTELRPLELGRLATGRPFVNSAAAGLASVAGRRAQPLKSRYGPLAYGIGAARAAASGRPLPVCVRVDGAEVFDGDVWQVIVACTGAFGGGIRDRCRGFERRRPRRRHHPGGIALGPGAAGVGSTDQDDRAAEGRAAL